MFLLRGSVAALMSQVAPRELVPHLTLDRRRWRRPCRGGRVLKAH